MSDMVSEETTNFLPRPRRLVFQTITNASGGTYQVVSVLSVGVFLRTKSNGGLRIVPVKEVLLAIGDGDNTEKVLHSIDADSAKLLRDRLDEFIKVCEAPVTSRETTTAVLNGGED